MTTDIYSEGLQIPIVKYPSRGQGQPGRRRHHPHERAAARPRDGRPARADRRGAAPASGASWSCSQRYGRDAVLGAIDGDHGPERGARARPQSATSPTASTRPNRSWTTTASTIGKRMPIRVKVIVKGDEMTVDLTDVSRAGARASTTPARRRASPAPGRVQVPHLAHRLSDQRRQLPRR